MNSEWSLKELYSGFDDPKFTSGLEELSSLITRFEAFTDELSGDPAGVLSTGLHLLQEISALSELLYTFASLKQSVDTADPDSAAVIGRLQQILSASAAPQSVFTKYIEGLGSLDTVVSSDPYLAEHSFFLKRLRDEARYILSPESERVMSLFGISGSSAWSDLQGYLTSTAPVIFHGEITTLSDIRNKAYDPSEEVRREAYEAELAAYDRIKDSVAFALNSIKLENINRCRLKGYESPLDATLKSSNMKRETLDALLGAMTEYLPKFHEYFKAKARLLGHENGLPWYDLFAPLEGNSRSFTAEECRDYLIGLFADFDEEESEMIKRAFDEAWIDFYPHSGKLGGAFCSGIHPLKASRILTNFNGSLGDVVTLAHELGHAFHNHCLDENSILNIDVSMPMAETASTFNELVAMNAAISSEGDPLVRRALIESQLMDAAQIICDIYSRYLFESAVFERRGSEFIFPDALCDIMLDAQKKAYGDGLDHRFLHPYMWVCKSHYYSGTLSFYNFPYAFGGLFARGLYAKYAQEGRPFVSLYKKLLKSTGSATVEDAALTAGIDLTRPEFWRSSLQILSDEIDEFISLC